MCTSLGKHKCLKSESEIHLKYGFTQAGVLHFCTLYVKFDGFIQGLYLVRLLHVANKCGLWQWIVMCVISITLPYVIVHKLKIKMKMKRENRKQRIDFRLITLTEY